MIVTLRRVQRIFVACFVVGVLICTWAFFSAAAQVRNAREDIERVETKMLGVTFFSASKSGRQVSIRPQLGVPLMLVAFPAFAAVVRYVTLKRRESK